ncbi:MAG: PA2169 family four-helix-bundle protein [Paracoccaceae bacterium]
MTDVKSTLSSLYTRLIDSRDGYEEILSNDPSAQVSAMVQPIVTRRRRDIDALRPFLDARGVDTDDDGSMAAAAHRMFVGLRDKFTNDDNGLVAEIARGEKALLSAYDDALHAAGAGDPEYALLSEQHAWLRDTVQGWDRKAA